MISGFLQCYYRPYTTAWHRLTKVHILLIAVHLPGIELVTVNEKSSAGGEDRVKIALNVSPSLTPPDGSNWITTKTKVIIANQCHSIRPTVI